MAARAGDARPAGEGGTGPLAGDSPAFDFVRIPPASSRASRTRAALGLLLIALDITALTGAFLLGYVGRATLPLFSLPDRLPTLLQYVPTMILHVAFIVTMFYLSRLYHLPRAVSRIDQARKIVGVVTVGSLLASAVQELVFKFTIFEVDYPRGMFFYVWVFSMLLVLVGREFYHILQTFLRERGYDRDNLLIVGMGKIARDIARKINDQPELGYNIVGVVVNGKTKTRGTLVGYPIIGTYQDLPRLIDTANIEQVIIALPEAQRAEIVELVTLCQRGHVDIKIYPDMFAYMAGDLSVDDLGGTPLLTVRDIALRGWKLSLKRGLDILGSFAGLVFLSPLMLLTALLIKWEDGGPVFYTQERMGLDGRPFEMIKFRSMRVDAEASGPGWTVENDPRVTRLGHFLRTTNWDEIPQLINVLVGQMSLVGPRPERPVYVWQFREHIPRYMERHREKSGMTGWAQVNGLRGDTSIAERTQYDLWYVENWSLWLDIKIIVRTIWQTVTRRDKNAY
ncbi:MAG: undecaprenyl-phosphate glucose phosphotransferase [Chloroflexi bacterium]|nr:undecaprenyl-phosphate glucose phosphotransferase [Chloroflexota bacterium]